MNKTLIYYTNGICKYSAEKSKIFIKKFFKTNVTLSDNIENLNDYSMICIPGGIGSKVIDKLKFNSCKINNFINDGGTYFGICCGAYLACQNIHFDDFTKKGLSLVNTDSIGPVYLDSSQERFDINNPVNIKIEPIFDIPNQTINNGYLHGGGYFNLNHNFITDDFNQRFNYKNNAIQINNKIILEAQYQDLKPAIISKKLGKGNIILSHIHPEHEYSNLNLTFKRIFESYNINLEFDHNQEYLINNYKFDY